MDCKSIYDLPREKLIEMIQSLARNCVAIDGVWFQSVEEKEGYAQAMEHDKNAWRRFSPIEARRIQALLSLPEKAGAEGLARALAFRFNSIHNEVEITAEENSVLYRVVTCRVQAARERKQLPYHACRPVAEIEYSEFAKVIDPRFETEILSCHPDVVDNTCHCACRFTLKECD